VSQPSSKNADQIEFWNTAGGERWASYQAQLDRFLAPFGDAVLDLGRAQPGEHVIDLGCGAGATSLALAKQVGETGQVIGVDVSGPLLERARERLAEHPELEPCLAFLQADAAQHTFDPQHTDLIASRFGGMFFDDPVAAYSHLHGALRTEGRLAMAVWRKVSENPWILVPLIAAFEIIGRPEETPDPHAPGPFAFAEEDRVRSILQEAGFRDIRIEPFDTPVHLGADLDETVTFAMELGPLSRMLMERSEEERARVREALASALKAHEGPEGITLGAATWLVSAKA